MTAIPLERPARDLSRHPLPRETGLCRVLPLSFAACLLLTGLPLLASEARAANETAGEEERLEALQREQSESAERAAELERQSAALRDEILAIKSEMISIARQTQDHEEQLTKIEDDLLVLEEEQTRRETAFRKQHGRLSGTLSALQRLAAQPPEALIAKPGSPIDAVRSAMLLSIAVPIIEDRALTVRREVEEILALRGEVAAERDRLAEAAATLEIKRGELDKLLTRKRDIEQQVASEGRALAEKAEKLAREANDVRDLIEKLAAEAAARAEAERLAAEEARRKAEEAAQQAAEAAAMERARKLEEARRAEAAAKLAAEQAEAERREAARLEAERAEAARIEAERQAEAERLQAEQVARDTTGNTGSQGTGPRLSDLPAVKLTKPDNVRSFPATPGQSPLVVPARGRFVYGYGEKVKGEPSTSKGITIETRSASQVVAPYDGKVAYAGPFRGYGEILIIEHGGRYHTLLAGLDRIDAVVGQWVLAGEPVGIMSAIPDSRPQLYLELRRTGQPINPLPWLAASDSKVQG